MEDEIDDELFDFYMECIIDTSGLGESDTINLLLEQVDYNIKE